MPLPYSSSRGLRQFPGTGQPCTMLVMINLLRAFRAAIWPGNEREFIAKLLYHFLYDVVNQEGHSRARQKH